MRYAFRTATHRLRTPFRVAYGTSDTRTTVYAFLGDGTGEGALVPYYPYRLDDLTAYLARVDGTTFGDEGVFDLDAALDLIPEGPAPARCALDVALYDHAGKQAGQPLWKLWGLDAGATPPSSFTLSIPSSEAELREAVTAAGHLPVLKLKVGTGDAEADVRLVALARSLTPARIGVDANSAWTVDEASRAIPKLADLGVLYVEQPLSWKDPDGHAAWHRLRERLPAGMPPLLADESVQHLDDVAALAGGADGVNVKLTKTGGLRGARAMIEAARRHGMQVLVGCMIESAVGVSAASHLAPLADFVDLDGAVLLADPVVTGGLVWDDGRLHLPDTPGIGMFTWHEVSSPPA
ncbi:MAG TPA: dipeptide epimerase [Rhodothermales bacterium]|nr:dipeptide epimerase [Rhodothermales bacterium]